MFLLKSHVRRQGSHHHFPTLHFINLASLVVQQILSALTGVNNAPNTTAPDPVNGTPPATPSLTIPTDVSSLIALLFSFSALRDWLKLIIIGGFFETCRRFAFALYYKIIGSFFLNVSFEEDDPSYDWIMVWLSKQPSWSKARDLQISTRSFNLNSTAVMIPGEEDDPASVIHGNRKLAYLPSVSSTYSIWYKRRWISITRTQAQTGYYGRREETLFLSIMTRHHSFLNDLLLEAKKEYMAAQENNISIYISDSSNNWRHVASRPKRPLKSIVLDPGIKDLLIDDAKDFLESKTWYTERGIPFRRGYLLYGAPGSGKTSMIHSMAGELGLDVYVISLSRAGLDDTSLSELISDLPERCIALMEDIDVAFHNNVNRDAPPQGQPPSPNGTVAQNGQAPPPPSTSRLSLSGLLNALDGVGAQEGRILYATTNKYTALDPALCRPGRMDIHVEFKLASKYQAQELFRCFYLPSDDILDADDDASEKESVDSGYSSSGNADGDLLDLDTSSEKSDASQVDLTPGTALEKPSFHGSSHRGRTPKLTHRQVTELAVKFSGALPEREFSMASLQGYLMTYKTRPFDAVKDASAWVEKERAEQVAKQKAAQTSASLSTVKPSEAPATAKTAEEKPTP